MPWVLFGLLILVVWLWSTAVAHLQFALVGVGAGLVAFGMLAISSWRSLLRERWHGLGAASPESLLHVVSLAPPHVTVQEGGAERYLGQSRAEAKVFLASVTTIASVAAWIIAFQSFDLAYVRSDIQHTVEPPVALAFVVLGAVLIIRAALRRFDPHGEALTRAGVALHESRSRVQAEIVDALRARNVALDGLRDAVASLGAPFDPAPHRSDLHLPIEPESVLRAVRADETRARAQAAMVAPQVAKLDRFRAQLDLLERDLDKAPVSRCARDAALALDDAYAVLQMLAQRLGMPGPGHLMEEIGELGRHLEGLQDDVDAACRTSTHREHSHGGSASGRPRSNYEVLGVSPSASASEIKAAYRRKAHENHPDRGGDPAAFRAVVQAYEALSRP